MKSALLICGVLGCLFLTLTGCQSERKMYARDGQCCYDRKVVHRSFSVKGTQWRQPRFETEQVCFPADAGTVCEPCE